jgi:hypothetical protein
MQFCHALSPGPDQVVQAAIAGPAAVNTVPANKAEPIKVRVDCFTSKFLFCSRPLVRPLSRYTVSCLACVLLGGVKCLSDNAIADQLRPV